MKVLLMHHDRDFDPKAAPPAGAEALTQDLELVTLFEAMAKGDDFLLEVAAKAVLGSLDDRAAILYRQDVLLDCIANAAVVTELYGIAVEAIEAEKKVYRGYFSDYPAAKLRRSIEVMQIFVGMLRRLRDTADRHAAGFRSEAFVSLFAMLGQELGEEYFDLVQHHLSELKLRNGVLISARLGQGNKGVQYTLRKPPQKRMWDRMTAVFARNARAYSFRIADRDESGAKALAELRDRGVSLVANALAQSVDHIVGFFTALRTELAFYIGCLNLKERLESLGHSVCIPLPLDFRERVHSFEGLYDAVLALKMQRQVVDNDGQADGKDVAIITGANQGGKSTFLRSIGLAQLMMQCGMFAPARSLRANLCAALFTHFKREEDSSMTSGKLDEELARMSGIVDSLKPNSLVLFNESFAATNEREGSEIARQIVSALSERRIKVFFVTHLYEFACSFFERNLDTAVFFRAERKADGTRTFRVVEGRPLPTSFGEDVYREVFTEDGRLSSHGRVRPAEVPQVLNPA